MLYERCKQAPRTTRNGEPLLAGPSEGGATAGFQIQGAQTPESKEI